MQGQRKGNKRAKVEDSLFGQAADLKRQQRTSGKPIEKEDPEVKELAGCLSEAPERVNQRI